MVGGNHQSRWTWEENKQFENCLVEFDGYPNRWERIASKLGTKSAVQVEQHYALLVADITAIEEGRMESSNYAEIDYLRPPGKGATPWTDDEHSKFLDGLEKYGKGNWKNISRYMVKTRNAAEVACHAHKYFEKEN